MPAITQPGGSIRLTNVSIVRLKKAGVRLEVAAYSNSVGAFRAGIESDADAVLQTRAVFSCAKKGTLPPRSRRRVLRRRVRSEHERPLLQPALLRANGKARRRRRADEKEF